MDKPNSDFYIGIIGDIVQSKEIPDRSKSQKRLQAVLSSLNAKYAGEIASRFMITLGDEFQGLLKCGKNTINIINEIEWEMHPVHIRFGIGIGEITTDINFDLPLGADGPAYHNARKMIELLKNAEKKNKFPYSNIMISSDGNDLLSDSLLNSILSLSATIKVKWTDRQRTIAFDCMKHGDNQMKSAERLGINQSSIHKSLTGSGYYSYISGMDTVSKELSKIGANQCD